MSTTVQTPLMMAGTVTSSTSATAGQHIPCDAATRAITLTLPTPTHVGARLRVEKVDSSANAVTVSGTLRGSAGTLSLTSQYQVVELFAETLASWRVASGGVGGGGGPASDATSSSKGVVQLAGDLGGVATAPTVTSGAHHSHGAAQISDASAVGKSVLTAADAPTARTAIGAGTPTSQVLAERCWDLTGYATPTTSSTTPARLHNDGVTFTVPASGWVRVSLSGAAWSAGGLLWMILNGDGTTVPRTQLTINSNNQPVQSQLEVLVNCTAQGVALTPGATVTWYWGWQSNSAGQVATFDNALSQMKVEAAEAPQGYTVGSDSVAGQTPPLTTVENVATVSAAAASVTTTFAATPQTKDLLLALVLANVATASWVLPGGWAVAFSQQVGTGTRYLGLAYKVAGASEPTSLTFTATGATNIAVHPWSKRGFTGTPAVALTGGQSLTGFTSGNIDTTGGLTTSPQYGVAAIGAGALVTISRIANGWDTTSSYAVHRTIFNDSGVSLAMGASDKLLSEIGANARMNPVLSAAQMAAAFIVTFSGV